MLNTQSILELQSGSHMPVLGLGTWQLTENTAGTIQDALQLGFRLIDTSGDYGTQPGIGQGIINSNIPREELYIVTKVEEDENSYEAVRRNLEELQLTYADLILIHRPPPEGVGEELWHGLDRARDEALVVDIGVSNYSKSQIEQLSDLVGEVPVVNQIEWSPFGYDADIFAFADERNVTLQAYSPLTRGERLNDPLLAEIGDSHQKSPAQILVRWSLQTGVVPIPKANQKKHLEELIDVFDFKLSDEEIKLLNDQNEQYSALGTLAYVE